MARSSRSRDVPPAQEGGASRFLTGLGIRSSLLLGFGAMSGVMTLAVLAALYFSSRINSAVGEILESRLPATADTLRVARAADALTATGLTLSTLSTKADRDIAFQQVRQAEAALDAALEDLKRVAGNGPMIPSTLFAELVENLHRLQNIVDERILLQERQAEARSLLLVNLLAFQKHLNFRIRILEGDGDVISHLMERPNPPLGTIAPMIGQLGKLLPVARFYATVQFINGRLLASGQSPTPASLNTLRREISASLESLDETMVSLPEDLKGELAQPVSVLSDLILQDNGLIRLRERELALLQETTALNALNGDILQRVNAATAQMAADSQGEMTRAGLTLMRTLQRSMLILAAVAGLGLLGVAGLMHFHVNRHVLTRLSWLSSAMQNVAAGLLDTSLPPAGSSELGRLGAALRQFRATAAEAREREAALQASNQWATQVMKELELANSKLTELSIRDPLTGLYNRRRFDETLKLEWARAGHGGKALALIILDVDHFKNFNDRYGHQAGDECLRKLALVFMRHARRAGDVATRYGGEEFCMVCPYTDRNHAEVLADTIRQAVLELGLPHEGSSFGVVTVSIGCSAAVPGEHCTAAELVHAADGALYAAKAAGRNCIRGADCPSGPPPA